MTNSVQPPESGSRDDDYGKWARFQPTEREILKRELQEAKDARRRATGWMTIFGVGPAAIIAVVLALVFGQPVLAGGFIALGIVVEVVRQWRLSRTVRDLLKALEDPMDGS